MAIVQTCAIYLVRNTFRMANHKYWDAMAKDLRPVYTAAGDRYFPGQPYALIGAWQVDDQGEVADEFTHNQDYRPSPQALGLDRPTDPVDAALQRAATGYGHEEDALVLLLDAELILYAREAGGLYTVSNFEGRRTIQVYTAAEHLPSEWNAWQTVRGNALAALRSGYDLHVNPGAQVSVRVPVEDLAATLVEWAPVLPSGAPREP